MKQLIVFAFLMVSISAFSQDPNNFSVNNGIVTWQKVFVTDLTFVQLSEKMKEKGILNHVEIAESKMIADLMPVDPDVKGAGYTTMSVPIYLANSRVRGFVMIEYKDGKYRVTLRNFDLIQKADNAFFKMGEVTKIENQILRNGNFANHFKKPAVVLDFTFVNLFTIIQDKTDDTW